ncbi:MAG: glutamyl-tRNA reductase [Gaiellaceae bacterium]
MAELALVGLSHHTAPLPVRERVAVPPEAAGELARRLADPDGEAVCLSTCNRTELYVAGQDAEERALGALEADLSSFLYRRHDVDAARHLFRVAAGLDSLVRGEAEILGQVRTAYALGAPGPLLDRLFREALRVGRKVRAQTALGDSAASIASAAAVLAERVLGDLSGRRAVVVGGGAVGGQTARFLISRGVETSIIRGRRSATAERLDEELAQADIVVSSTSSPGLVLGRVQVEQALASRSRRPLLLIDLAVPRDLDPAIGELAYAFLYDLDDLDDVVGGRLTGDAAARAEAIVAEEAERFRAWQASRGVVPAIASLRARAEEIRAAELARASGRLGRLSDDERRAVDALTAQIVNKLLHGPTVRLKEAAAGADGAAYADAVRHLFELDDERADPNRLSRQ